MVNETVFDTAMGAVGAIPIVGDVVATAGQVLKSGNKNSWRSFFATFKAIPDAVNIAGQAVADAEENVKVLRQTNQQFQKMANAINNITKADEMKTVAGTKGKKKSKKLPRTPANSQDAPAIASANASANRTANAAAAGGGKTRKKRKKKRRKRRKKSTKKKARKH
jgi:hypothetical protein